MFDSIDFYPTRPETIAKMVAGLRLQDFYPILDACAGTGNIANYVRNQIIEATKKPYGDPPDVKIDVVEIEPNFQHILTGNNFRLVHDNFLTFDTYTPYDLIIANFPFSIGVECVNKALDLITRSGGHLRCLINAETLRNPFNGVRKFLIQRLESLNAEVEYLQEEFVDAERTTNVEVALIKVYVKPQPSTILLNELQAAEEKRYDGFAPKELVSANFMQRFVDLYKFEATTCVRMIEEWHSMLPYMQDRIKREGQDYSRPVIKLQIAGETRNTVGANVLAALRELREKYWALLIRDPQFTGKFTSNVIKELEAKLKELRAYDFTLFNIQALEKELSTKLEKGIEAAIMKMFDDFSYQHHWHPEMQKNLHFFSGWAANKAHKINHRIILPMNGFNTMYSKYDKPSWHYYIKDNLRDLIRAFNYLTDKRVDENELDAKMKQAEIDMSFRLNLGVIEVKFHKKGTAHIKFLDKDFLDRLNIFGAQHKKWLPPSYLRKTYEEMNGEEKEVVEAFQGRQEYEKMMQNPNHYLVEFNILQLTA